MELVSFYVFLIITTSLAGSTSLRVFQKCFIATLTVWTHLNPFNNACTVYRWPSAKVLGIYHNEKCLLPKYGNCVEKRGASYFVFETYSLHIKYNAMQPL